MHPDFAGVDRAEFDEIVRHMLDHGYLFEAGDLLPTGDKAERVYGRKNFMEMYAVFLSPVLHRVQTGQGRELGSLKQDFVDRLVEEMSSFLLAGRAWSVDRVNQKDRIVLVSEPPRGKKPNWGGFFPQLLGFDLCQRIKQVLASSEDYPYVDQAAREALQIRRDDMGELLRREFPIQTDGASIMWRTCAGGQINYTLKYGLKLLTGWKVVANNSHLSVGGDGATDETLRAQVAELGSDGFWRGPQRRRAVLGRLPEYRLSKFQAALPGIPPKKWTPALCGVRRFGLVLSLHRLEVDGAEVAERRVAAA